MGGEDAEKAPFYVKNCEFKLLISHIQGFNLSQLGGSVNGGGSKFRKWSILVD